MLLASHAALQQALQQQGGQLAALQQQLGESRAREGHMEGELHNLRKEVGGWGVRVAPGVATRGCVHRVLLEWTEGLPPHNLRGGWGIKELGWQPWAASIVSRWSGR